MENKDFEVKVLKALDGLNTRFDCLEGRFDGLEGRFDGLEGRFDSFEREVRSEFKAVRSDIERLDNKLDEQTFELKQEIRSQGTYLNQAFEHISRLQAKEMMKGKKSNSF